jgi:hypothetical protein
MHTGPVANAGGIMELASVYGNSRSSIDLFQTDATGSTRPAGEFEWIVSAGGFLTGIRAPFDRSLQDVSLQFTFGGTLTALY